MIIAAAVGEYAEGVGGVGVEARDDSGCAIESDIGHFAGVRHIINNIRTSPLSNM